ncbi:MAG: hypothetical protein FJ109_18005 [Deltaproteobacteria bacterium]|nr:hypothetical protein [Deltaproteobacteria bacterium]
MRVGNESSVRDRLAEIAQRFGLRILYAFGSRSVEALDMVEGRRVSLAQGPSDLDLGYRASPELTVDRKVELASALEDLFGVGRVDLVDATTASPTLAFAVVCGELLYAADPGEEARFQLEIMRRYADLKPLLDERRRLSLGE